MKLALLTTLILGTSLPIHETLDAMGTFKKPSAKLPALPSNASPEQDQTSLIKLHLDNQLPEGLIIKPIYEEYVQEPSLYVKDTGPYTKKIKSFVIKDGAFFMLTTLLFIDRETGKIEKQLSVDEVVHMTPQQRIVIFRTRKQLPPLENTAPKSKPIRRSPTSILEPIAEENTEESFRENNNPQESFNEQQKNALLEKKQKMLPYSPTKADLERGRKAHQERSTLPH